MRLANTANSKYAEPKFEWFGCLSIRIKRQGNFMFFYQVRTKFLLRAFLLSFEQPLPRDTLTLKAPTSVQNWGTRLFRSEHVWLCVRAGAAGPVTRWEDAPGPGRGSWPLPLPWPPKSSPWWKWGLGLPNRRLRPRYLHLCGTFVLKTTCDIVKSIWLKGIVQRNLT